MQGVFESLKEQYDNEYRTMDNFGIQFHIDEIAYECELEHGRVSFGESELFTRHGADINFQDIFIDGKKVGILKEYAPYNVFMLKPILVSFIIPLPDEVDDDRLRNNQHFVEGERNELRFATLQQMIDYLGVQ